MTGAELHELRLLERIALRKREYRISSCDGKQGFSSPSQARKAIRTFKAARETNIYRCEHCGQWHIGGAQAGRKKRKHQRLLRGMDD